MYRRDRSEWTVIEPAIQGLLDSVGVPSSSRLDSSELQEGLMKEETVSIYQPWRSCPRIFLAEPA